MHSITSRSRAFISPLYWSTAVLLARTPEHHAKSNIAVKIT
jgi:hypothetical protein